MVLISTPSIYRLSVQLKWTLKECDPLRMTFILQWLDKVLVKSSQVAWLCPPPPASQIGNPLSWDWSTGPKPEGSHSDNEQWA